jgi:hypothetical protein
MRKAILLLGVPVLVVLTLFGNFANVQGQGTNAGDLDGQVIDGSPGSSHPGIVGASVCFVSVTGCAVTNSTGGFLFQNVAGGQYSIQVTASGFIPSPQISVSISTGKLNHAGQIGLQPATSSPPWYQSDTPFIFALIGLVIAVGAISILVLRVRRLQKQVEQKILR